MTAALLVLAMLLASVGDIDPASSPAVELVDKTQPTVTTPGATGPTATAPGHSLRGVASWFATGPDGLYAAAGPALRVGHWRGRVVRVCAAVCIRVTLNDWCACPDRLIDLSDQAFRRLAPLSVGLITVRVWP